MNEISSLVSLFRENVITG